MTAWGDESGSRPDRDGGAYLMGAALCDDTDVSAVRATMAALRATEPKVHWHGSSELRRRDLIDAVAALPIMGLAVVHVEVGATDRRQRRKRLEHLLPQLADLPCSTVTLESRSKQDASDLDLLQKPRARRVIASTLQIKHIVGRLEPVLWAADIICGAVVADRCGAADYLKTLGQVVAVRVI